MSPALGVNEPIHHGNTTVTRCKPGSSCSSADLRRPFARPHFFGTVYGHAMASLGEVARIRAVSCFVNETPIEFVEGSNERK